MLNKFYSLVIPDAVRLHPESYAHAKIFLGAALLTLIGSPLYAYIYYVLNFPLASCIILLAGFVIECSVILFLFYKSIFWTREIIVITLFATIFWLTYNMGGVDAPSAIWIILPPLTAFFFGGTRAGIFSSVLCITAVVALFLLEYFHIVMPISPISNVLLLQVVSIVGLMIIILFLAYFYERGEIESSKEVQRTNKELEKSLEIHKRISQKLADRTRSLEIQKSKTEAERYSKNLLQNILESSIEYSIIATNLDGLILIWNAGASNNYGYTTEEMVEKRSIWILHNPQDVHSGVSKKFLDTAYKFNKAEGIFERIRKDHSRFLASVVATLRRDESGIPVGFVIISKDITEQKQLEDDLKKNNKELEQFAYIASHDLKAPLRAIERLATWIEEDNATILPEQSKENLALLRQRVGRMSNLIAGILQYSRVGRLEIDPQTINTKQLLKEVIENLNSPPAFVIHYSEGLPIFQGYQIPLAQVFSNLIDNGIKHHHRHAGNITIGVHESEDNYTFFVSDDGPGIAQEYQEKIFQIFQTLQSRDEFESTGIGLSIVKKIVESQGGKVLVNSEVGKGSTFFFTWPKFPKRRKR